jgi:outer membrane protein assembly factor BamB
MALLRVLAVLCASALAASDWPQLLGPHRDGSYTGPSDALSLRQARLLWKKDVGQGFSSPVVKDSKLILFHRLDDRETIECLDAKTGKRLWTLQYAASYRDDFGFDEGPRGTPTIDDGRVYTFGAEGVLQAVDFATGAKAWRVDTHAKFHVRKGFFGAAASPLVEGRAVYVNIGGPNGAGIVAFDKKTGNVLWAATDDDAGYSSPIAATIGGVRTILCITRNGLVAADPASGKVRFRYPFRSRSNASVNAAVPVVAGDLIFISASYGAGAALLSAAAGGVDKVWTSDDALSSHYSTSVHKDGYLYGFDGRQEFGQRFRCVEMKTGKVRWSADDFGAGTVTLAGERLLIVRENGEAVLAPASPDAFRPTEKAQLLPGVVRAYPALADGCLYVRNEKTLAAYSLTR